MATDSRTKDYSGRPSEITSELDDLRNRGIAKGLNRHFTDATRKLAKEKAEADSALADLERRRANKSEFVPSRGGELNPFDSMYVELQAKRTECRRKEKETMLLYQRYVHKYGKKAKVAAPAKEDLKSASPSKNAPASKKTPALPTTEAPTRSPPSPPVSPSKIPLEPLDENSESESAVDQDVNFSKFYNKQLSDRVGGDAPSDPPADPPGMLVSPDPPTGKAVSEVPAEIPGFNEITPQTSEKTETLPLRQTRVEENIADSKPKAEKPSKPDPEESGVVDGGPSDYSDESGTRPTALVTTEMPSATTATDDDDTDDRSVISGLTTTNSVYMTHVIDEIETEMECFLKTETLAIQKMLDSEDEKSTLSNNFNMSVSGNASVFGDESVRVAMKAEAMAKEMQKILDDFEKDDRSASVQGDSHAESATKEDDEASTATARGYPRKYNVSIPGEEWMVYYDEANKREYFFEKNSNRTQWHPPSQSHGREEVDETHEYRSPRRTTRKEQYRRRVRKRRIRRMVMLSFVALCGVATYFHWQINHPQRTYPEAMKATLNDIQTYDWQGAVAHVKDPFEYTFTDRRKREETQKEREKRERMGREAKARQEEERKAREREERQRQEELLEEQKAKEEAQRREAEEKRLAEEKGEALRREREAAERREREEAQRRVMAQREEMKRPWGCNIPLAYVVRSRCRKLAKSNPMYDESDLLNSFLL
jgi:septal ring factor EnvC (AmiA/AmiB activator)